MDLKSVVKTWITEEYARMTGRKRGALQKALLKVLKLVESGVDPVNMAFADDDDMQFMVTRFRTNLIAMHISLHGIQC